MKSSNWQDALMALKAEGNLPEGEIQESAKPSEAPKKDHKLLISMEKKGRGGKIVTIVSGFSESYEEVADLAACLKSKLGTGGSARGGEILIQGDRREQLRELLHKMGYKV